MKIFFIFAATTMTITITKTLTKTVAMRLSDEQIIAGFRRGDSQVIRQYFYEYCRVA